MNETIYQALTSIAILLCVVAAVRAHAYSVKTRRFATGLAHLLRGQQDSTEYLLRVTRSQRERIEALESTHTSKTQ